MANRTQEVPLPPITTFTAGARAYSQINSGKRTGYIDLVITAVLTLAGGSATVIRNNGSILGAIDFIGLEENGDDIVYIDARMAAMLSAVVQPRTGYNARLRALTDGAYQLREVVRIPFAWPLSGAAWDTAHVERDPRQTTQVFVVTNGNAANIVTTAGTAVISDLQVQPYQTYDDQRVTLAPYFVPHIRMTTQPVAGAVNGLEFFLKGGVPQRGLLLMADTNVGVVNDVITSVKLQDDVFPYIGPRAASFANLSQKQALTYGGDAGAFGGNIVAAATDAPGFGSYFHNWQDGGRLSTCYNPRTAGENLRWTVDAVASVTAGATSQVLKCAIIELHATPGITRALPANFRV